MSMPTSGKTPDTQTNAQVLTVRSALDNSLPANMSTDKLEQYAFQLINCDRKIYRRLPLSFDQRLSKIARDYAEYMVAHNHFGHLDLEGHNGQYRAQQAGITCSVDENFRLQPRLATSEDMDILNNVERSVIAEQTDQRSQRENILAQDHVYVGIGISRSKDKLIMVQEFTRVDPSSGSLPTLGEGDTQAARSYTNELSNEISNKMASSIRNISPTEIGYSDSYGDDKIVDIRKGYVPLPVRGGMSDPQDDVSINQLENHMLELTNRDRTTFGALPVQLNIKLNEFAQGYAEYMLRSKFIGHVDPKGRNLVQRARQAGITCGVYENIACLPRGPGSAWSKDMQRIDGAEDSFMSEPSNQQNHRDNILLPKHICVGIGVARAENYMAIVEEYTDQDPLQPVPSHEPVVSYMNYVDGEIKQHWHAPPGKTSRTVVVHFHVHNDGFVSNLELDPSSGPIDDDVQAAFDAVKASTPFVPPSSQVLDYERSQGGIGDMVPICFTFDSIVRNQQGVNTYR